MEQEFTATLAWFANPTSQASAHIVISASGTIARVVDPELTAWHAGAEANATYLGAELVQPRAGDHITDGQLVSLAWWLKEMAARYGFPLDRAHLLEHREIPQGIAQKKSDIGPDYSLERLAPFLA